MRIDQINFKSAFSDSRVIFPPKKQNTDPTDCFSQDLLIRPEIEKKDPFCCEQPRIKIPCDPFYPAPDHWKEHLNGGLCEEELYACPEVPYSGERPENNLPNKPVFTNPPYTAGEGNSKYANESGYSEEEIYEEENISSREYYYEPPYTAGEGKNYPPR